MRITKALFFAGNIHLLPLIILLLVGYSYLSAQRFISSDV